MLKKTIIYTDYDGNERKEDFYFNLTRAELLEMNMNEDGGMQKMIEKIIAAQDNKRIFALFKDVILKAYGEKSPDGRRFIKSKEISDGFKQTEAYSILLTEIATDAEKAVAFVNGIIPSQDAPKPVPNK